MTDREAMQQALEAMGTVGADWICEASHHAKKDQHKWGEPCPLQQRWHIAYQAVRERLEQPEQEPVAWMIWTQGPVSTFLKKYEAESEFDRLNRQYPEPSRKLIALYTTPPRREWVGLTKKEKKLFSSWLDHKTDDEVFSAIEAKLREKNNE